jgi:2-C-methyl-D-erythritol 4-phosphate cytidylyltransferase
MPPLAVILPAAGASSRFGKDKLATMLAGRSVLERSVDLFRKRPDVAQIIVVGRRVDDPTIDFAAGGACRAESVRNALAAVRSDIEWVAIHDAARPLASQDLIDRTLAAAHAHGAAGPAMAVHLTIKQVSTPPPSKIDRTVPRAHLYAMQTPQIARRQDLVAAFEKCPIPLEQITDDLQLLELAGIDAWIVEGEDRNIKITTPLDLKLAELLVE